MKKFIVFALCTMILVTSYAKTKKYRVHKMKKTAPASGWVDNWQAYYQSKVKK